MPQKVCKPQPNWPTANWLRMMEPARSKSCLSGQRRGPATPGEKRVSSSDQKPFHISTTPSTRERKRRSPWSIPLHRLCKPQPNFLVADRRRLMEPGRGESCLSRQRRGPAAPGEDKFLSPGQNIVRISATSTTRGRKRRSSGSIPPPGCGILTQLSDF